MNSTITFKKGDWVCIVKLGEKSDALFPSASWDHSKPKEIGLFSLPVDYTVEGLLNSAPMAGEALSLHRYIRNGVEARGIFQTSEIMEIDGDHVSTRNSIYRIERKPIPQHIAERMTS